jgi:hypothetical protein
MFYALRTEPISFFDKSCVPTLHYLHALHGDKTSFKHCAASAPDRTNGKLLIPFVVSHSTALRRALSNHEGINLFSASLR